MTKGQALIAMKLGHKVSHVYFSDEEYLYIKDGDMYSEEGYNFEEGWRIRTEKCFNKGWRIYNGRKEA